MRKLTLAFARELLVGSPGRWKAYAAVAVALLALPGCAGQMMQERSSKYVGQPVSVLFAKMGLPTDERMLAGKKVYIWATSTFDEGTQLQCKFRAVVGPGEIVEGFDWEGNNGPCLRYAMRL